MSRSHRASRAFHLSTNLLSGVGYFWNKRFLGRRTATRFISHPQLEALERRQVLSASTSDAAFAAAIAFEAPDELDFSGSGGAYPDYEHTESMELADGTVAFSFTADSVTEKQGLFSKDHTGYQQGGHLTAFLHDGRIEVRLQSDNESVQLHSADGSIVAGQEHHVAIGFGENGFRLYVDGLIADAEVDFTQGIELNENPLVIGANAWARDGEHAYLRNFLEGTVEDFTVYAGQYDLDQMAEMAGLDLTPPASPVTIDGVLFGTDGGELLISPGTQVEGGYSDDIVYGMGANEILAGGHGEDIVSGGGGDDILISRSDGREPVIDQLYDAEDDPYGEVDPLTRTLYSDQPIASDDMFHGGDGADTFRFEILINAKERILFKHVNDDGTIDWAGVTGENRLVHDHWVERIGDEVILDFNRDEGDTIEIVGHTVDVYKVTHHDSDGDGVLDSSVLHLQSNQGNAGAHNKDKLGTVTVYGDLIRESDYTVHAHANLGIVETIGELGEALAARYGDPVVSDGVSRWLMDEIDEAPLPSGAIFAVGQPLEFNVEEEEYIQVAHSDALALPSGTVALSFTTDDVSGRQTLFSKDHVDYQQGGHLTVQVVEGRIEVRLQSDSESEKLYSAVGSIVAGQEHHVAVSFGADGVRLFVDGLIADADVDFTQGIDPNDNPLVIGAGAQSRNGEKANLREFFQGLIHEFSIYDEQLSLTEVAEIAGLDLTPPSSQTMIDGVLVGKDKAEFLIATNDQVNASYGNDIVYGLSASERLDGGHGEDIVSGGGGDDILISRSDGREPVIDQLYDADDDPYGEVDPLTRTLYSDQPIASDDMFHGGDGADTFRFEILINAKERILFKHVNDDGTIDWAGVTGENRLVHDHWVERIGDEVILDFNRDEGDTIEIVGHTVDVYKVTHHDSDGDGVLDSSVLHLQSNQGNAGAHNKDKLGTVTVYGDLIRESDYTVHAHANLGIVETIGELGEALAARYGDPVVSDGVSRWLMDEIDEAPLPSGAIFAVGQPLEFNVEEEEYIQVAHSDALALPSGTVALSFTTDDVSGRQTLFSKDHVDYQQGGHLTVQVVEGRIEVRLQSDSTSKKIYSPEGSIVAGQTYEIAVQFGEGGLRLYVDGELVASKAEFTQGIEANDNPLVIGAGAQSRNGEKANLRDYFQGEIHDFAIYGGDYDPAGANFALVADLAFAALDAEE